jgi:hypothetical protein
MLRGAKILGFFFLALVPLCADPATLRGTLKTDIFTTGGDCAHRWWLRLEANGNRRGAMVALEPEDSVPAGLKDDHVQVEGELKTCRGVEGGGVKVIVIKSIKPIPKY